MPRTTSSNQVIPFSNQQFSVALGGPILRDRLHYFGNFEYDRTPKTSIWNTPFPAFNVTLNDKESKKIAGGRVDFQISPSMRLMGKVSGADAPHPVRHPSATQHPASTNSEDRVNREYMGQFTQVLSNRALNEVKVGFAEWNILQGNLTNWSNHWAKDIGVTEGHPRVQMVGFTIAGNQNAPRIRDQNSYMFRDDFTFNYDARGRHDLKAGGEYVYMDEFTRNCRNCMSQIDARVRAIPADVMQAIFPDPFNADTWNLNALGPYTRRFTLGISETFQTPFNVPKVAAWVQDDWHVSNSLTLNLGLRYDVLTNNWANDASVPPILEPGRPNDTNNIQPRLGFAYQVNDRTVVRGGVGRYYADILSNLHMWTYGNESIASVEVNNDGRPDFVEQSVQRSAALAGAGICQLLRCEPQAGLSHTRIAGTGAAAAVRQGAEQLADLDRLPASDRRGGRGRGRLRLQRQPEREGDPGERQPLVQPGDRRAAARTRTRRRGPTRCSASSR